jgi:hypothetical protein
MKLRFTPVFAFDSSSTQASPRAAAADRRGDLALLKLQIMFGR